MTTRTTAMCAVLLLVGCGEGAKQRSPEAVTEQGDVAGGETSEFSGGDIPFCPEAGATIVPLELEAPGLASWVALAEGQHELPLRWAAQFPSDAVRGFEEQSTVTLDVTVLSARDVIFGEANLGYEGSGCKGSRQRQIELGIELRTADGALEGSFTHWVTPRIDRERPGQRLLASTNKEGNGRYPLADFTSTLAIDIDLGEASEQDRELYVLLTFSPGGLRGSLELVLTTFSIYSWGFVRPLGATFPNDGCDALAWPVDLDERASVLADTPRAVYRSLRAELERGPIPALWGPSLEPPSEGRWTEVTLLAGEPTHACRSAQGISVQAPLTVRTADGLVDHTHTVMTNLYVLGGGAAGRGGSGEANMPFMAAADFERVTGLAGVDLGDSPYGGARLRSSADSSGVRQGALIATRWEQGEGRTVAPGLAWCDGADCDRFLCDTLYGSSDCSLP